MEPAVERREHLAQAMVSAAKKDLPQWSPPLKGGSTPPGMDESDFEIVAAMEPAVGRREHHRRRRAVGRDR